MTSRRPIVAAMLMMASLLCLLSASANADNSITGLRSGTAAIDDEVAARLVIETSAPAQVSMLLLSNPYRLVIDFKATKWNVSANTDELRPLPLLQYRRGQPDATTTRLVIDLDGPAAPVRAFRLAPNNNGNGHRFVLDILDRGETAFKLAARALTKNRDKLLNLGVVKKLGVVTPPLTPSLSIATPLPRPTITARIRDSNGLLLPILPPRALPRQAQAATAKTPRLNPVTKPKSYTQQKTKWVVFIDAGHGGKDPGAIGVSGQKEKEVTLKAAIELARQLNATGKVKAVLSRNSDVFHKLRKRIGLARATKADVFISLHADAATNRKARGASVFTLSEYASDKEAERLAARENKADLIGGPDLDTTDPAITNALLGMFQRESMNQSSVLAQEIIAEFNALPTPKRGHRFAGFAVLKSPDIPSVLIEMGFLTNKSDERNLKNAAYRRDLMAKVTAATLRYLTKTSANP
ncbi:MAG: N-acetylmuramoyl-L-alanine amidase [Candidatus Puniceispirillales bacterium WSBS_2018_MAG_OTU23]